MSFPGRPIFIQFVPECDPLRVVDLGRIERLDHGRRRTVYLQIRFDTVSMFLDINPTLFLKLYPFITLYFSKLPPYLPELLTIIMATRCLDSIVANNRFQ